MAAIASTPTVTPYARAFEITSISQHDISDLIMDFLVTEGYPEVAKFFAEEANIETGGEDAFMEERAHIREVIIEGDVQAAIDEIGNIDPQLLDKDKALLFSLLRLQLIGLIKKIAPAPESEKRQLVQAALDFAKENLAPYAPQNETFKKELERTMALLIVPADTWKTSSPNQARSAAFGSLRDLIDPHLRVQVARDVNAAILKSLGRRPSSNIHKMLQMRQWAENSFRAKNLPLPSNLKVNLKDTPADTETHNGNGDTQMTEAEAEERFTTLRESGR